MSNTLRCETCHRKIEKLSEREALDDISPHGWTNWKTAHSIKCFDCASRFDDYETYYAGRIKKGHPDKVFQMFPDMDNPEKEIECYCYRNNTKEAVIPRKDKSLRILTEFLWKVS